jgi:hypothetical protein
MMYEWKVWFELIERVLLPVGVEIITVWFEIWISNYDLKSNWWVLLPVGVEIIIVWYVKKTGWKYIKFWA